MEFKYVIVGAGLTGLVLAERIANVLSEPVLLIEKKGHIGGACYDCYDEYGVLIGKYGPHTFHTNDQEVFDYFSQFAEWNHYTHRAMSCIDGRLVHFPICHKTLFDLYGVRVKDDEFEKFIESHSDDIVNKFFRDFTLKQWGCRREELDPKVLERIPFRNSDDDRYFQDDYQGNPVGGYTKMLEKMIANDKIKLLLNTDYKDVIGGIEHALLLFTGPIDSYFDYRLGKLKYRSVQFIFEHYEQASYQSCPSTRYPGLDVPYTRITEFKKMTSQDIPSTTILKEIPCFGGEPYYPYPTPQEKALAAKYRALAAMEPKALFVGRLGEYRYYDMDDVVRRALDVFEEVKRRL